MQTHLNRDQRVKTSWVLFHLIFRQFNLDANFCMSNIELFSLPWAFPSLFASKEFFIQLLLSIHYTYFKYAVKAYLEEAKRSFNEKWEHQPNVCIDFHSLFLSILLLFPARSLLFLFIFVFDPDPTSSSVISGISLSSISESRYSVINRAPRINSRSPSASRGAPFCISYLLSISSPLLSSALLLPVSSFHTFRCVFFFFFNVMHLPQSSLRLWLISTLQVLSSLLKFSHMPFSSAKHFLTALTYKSHNL